MENNNAETTQEKSAIRMICKNCFFYKGGIYVTKSTGDCHRHPPTSKASWPTVHEDDYCSEFTNEITISSDGITTFINTTGVFINQENEPNQDQKES